MARSYDPKYHNREVLIKGISQFVKETKAEIVMKLKEVARRMVDFVEGNFTPIPPYRPGGNDDFPVWEGQMRDSTGVGLYVDGRTEYYMPTPKRDGPQHSNNYAGEIWGHEMLQQAITDMASKLPTGIWIVLFSAVPYAYKVNTIGSPRFRGIDYFEKTVDEMTSLILSSITPGTPSMFGFNV